LCFSTDQTVGTGGKWIGLGQQSGNHLSASIVTPFPVGSRVVSFVAKATQGNNPVSGTATLYRDGPTPNGQPLSLECPITPSGPDDLTTICRDGDVAAFFEPGEGGIDGAIGLADGLSVFFQTDGGSWAGTTACILIEPSGGI